MNTIKNCRRFQQDPVIYMFMTVSSPRHEHRNKVVSKFLSSRDWRKTQTRCYYWYAAVKKIKLRIKTISEVLEEFSKKNLDKNSATEAKDLLLQNPRINFIVATNLISLTQKKLLSLRSEKFRNDIFEEAGVLNTIIVWSQRYRCQFCAQKHNLKC